MKIYLILISLLFSAYLYAQIPGCVPIRGNYLWMSTTEVTNQHYADFLKGIGKKDSLKNLPNSEMWTIYKYCEPMRDYYFRHPAYQQYPVVNITYEQATAYCEWVTTKLNSIFPNQKVIVRLPTEKEWEYAARAGNDFAIYPWGTETMRVEAGKYQGEMQANFIRGKGEYMGITGNLNDGADITAPAMSYWPNDFGLYNMSGNVAEMVAEKGLVKGGSWRNRADWLRIDKQQYVYSASPEVGFRYVVEFIKLPQPKKTPKAIKLDKRFFKKYFAKINDTLFVGKYEVTNQLFQNYLSQIFEDSVKTPKIESSNWNGLFPYSEVWANNYTTNTSYANYPVVNIDYKSAMSFCDFFTSEYEKVFGKNTQIRLPTEEEWKLVASGGLEDHPYSWGGPYIRDSKGNFLANHNPKINESENVNGYDTLSLYHFFQSYFTDLEDYDGEAVIAPVDSYFSNGYGVYNIAGNVAEMILDSNFTKGGSWKSNSYYLQISSKEKWDYLANPFTGFRVVMIRKKD